MTTNPRDANLIERWADVPVFTDEAEEDAFWASHSLGPSLLETFEPVTDPRLPPPRRRGEQRLEPVGIDAAVLARFKEAAQNQGVPYRKLIETLMVAWCEQHTPSPDAGRRAYGVGASGRAD